MCSWAIWLTAFLESFGLLIVFRNLTDGEKLSMHFAIFTHLDWLHLVDQSFFSLSLWSLLNADGLLKSGFLRYRGRRETCEECLLATFLASKSAFSFPSMPTCPADHLSINLYLHLLLHFCIWFARQSASVTTRFPSPHVLACALPSPLLMTVISDSITLR